MPYKRLQIAAFFVFFFLLLVLVALVLRPFVSILAVAVMMAILIEPLQARILTLIKSRTIASLLAMLIVAGFVSLILVLAGRILITDISGVYDRVQSGDLVISHDQIVQNIPVQLRDSVENITRNLNSIISRFSNDAFNSISAVVSNIAGFLFGLFLLLFSTFYLLRDGPRIKEIITDLSPLATRQEDILFKRIVSAVNGVIKGSFMTAICQGIMATIGFFIFGVPSPIVWGFFVVLMALIPTVGTALALIPAILYLLITGQVPQAIGLTIWAFFSIGLIDNVIGPRVVGAQARLHPLLVLLSVLGGLIFFGPLGFLIGPILMAVFVATTDIYRTDFKDYFFS